MRAEAGGRRLRPARVLAGRVPGWGAPASRRVAAGRAVGERPAPGPALGALAIERA